MSNYMGCGAQLDKDNLEKRLLAFEESGDYVAEEKLDGQWAEIWVKKGTVIKIISRTGKPKPFEPLFKYKFPIYATGIFVGEIGYGSTNSKLRENIAVLYDWVKILYNGKLLKASRYNNALRRLVLETVLKDELNPGVLLVERRRKHFFKFYKTVLTQHGEGIIIKKMEGLDTVYKKGTRSPNWIKVKKGVEVDMVVMGVNWRDSKEMSEITKQKGMDAYIKDVVCGQYFNGKLRKQVRVGSMTDKARGYFSKGDRIGQVVSIRGFEQFPKTGSIRHCSLVTRDNGDFIRDDLTPKDCVFGKIKII